jgi:serine phosphatase RsbU (regulator of sigma subunit)
MLISTIFGISALTINLLFNFPLVLNIAILITACVCFILYYLGRFKKIIKPFKIPVLFLAFFIVGFSWFYNGGLEGSTSFFLIFMCVIFLFMNDSKYFILLLSFIIFAAALIVAEYFFPKNVTPYPSHQAKVIDLTLNLILSIFIIGYTVILFKRSYDSERKIIQNQKQQIEIHFDNLTKLNIRLTSQNEEITVQRDELEQHKKEIEQKNKSITDSIVYASQIQNSMLPNIELLRQRVSDCFVFYKPRDIISGDFYWFKKIGKKMFISVADCTGHGVPGALMSMLGISFLNEIVTGNSTFNTGQILDNLRENIKHSLQQYDPHINQKDGMDIILISIDINNLELQFSGAYNPIYIVRKKNEGNENNETTGLKISKNNKIEITQTKNASIIEFKADRQPVAVYLQEKEFTTQNFQLRKSDILYAATDGYTDQFGGKNHKKFLIKNFRNLLAEIYDKPIPEQKEIFESTFEHWKKGFEQVDDILVLGVKI